MQAVQPQPHPGRVTARGPHAGGHAEHKVAVPHAVPGGSGSEVTCPRRQLRKLPDRCSSARSQDESPGSKRRHGRPPVAARAASPGRRGRRRHASLRNSALSSRTLFSPNDNNARAVLITQQDELHRRAPEALGGRFGRWRHRLWGWLGSYGYQAHRLVAALGVVLALAGGLAYVAGQVQTRPGHHAAERIAPASLSGTPCSTVELIGVGIDRGLPLGTTGLPARCDLDTGTRRGQAFTAVLWLLQALLWALATLAIAGYTGLVRKPA